MASKLLQGIRNNIRNNQVTPQPQSDDFRSTLFPGNSFDIIRQNTKKTIKGTALNLTPQTRLVTIGGTGSASASQITDILNPEDSLDRVTPVSSKARGR